MFKVVRREVVFRGVVLVGGYRLVVDLLSWTGVCLYGSASRQLQKASSLLGDLFQVFYVQEREALKQEIKRHKIPLLSFVLGLNCKDSCCVQLKLSGIIYRLALDTVGFLGSSKPSQTDYDSSQLRI
jgi:hypothetical protein